MFKSTVVPVCYSNSHVSHKCVPGLIKVLRLYSVNILVPELDGYWFGATSPLDSYKAMILETVDLSMFRHS